MIESVCTPTGNLTFMLQFPEASTIGVQMTDPFASLMVIAAPGSPVPDNVASGVVFPPMAGDRSVGARGLCVLIMKEKEFVEPNVPASVLDESVQT